MVKKYSSPCVKFTINVKKDGKSIPVVFEDYDPDERRRWKKVSDPEIQEQMEKSKDFNVYFRLDEVIEEEPVTAAPKQKEQELPQKEPLKVITKKDFLESKRWLNSIGVPYSKMKDRKTVVALAIEQGYDLSFESDKK